MCISNSPQLSFCNCFGNLGQLLVIILARFRFDECHLEGIIFNQRVQSSDELLLACWPFNLFKDIIRVGSTRTATATGAATQ